MDIIHLLNLKYYHGWPNSNKSKQDSSKKIINCIVKDQIVLNFEILNIILLY